MPLQPQETLLGLRQACASAADSVLAKAAARAPREWEGTQRLMAGIGAIFKKASALTKQASVLTKTWIGKVSAAA